MAVTQPTGRRRSSGPGRAFLGLAMGALAALAAAGCATSGTDGTTADDGTDVADAALDAGRADARATGIPGSEAGAGDTDSGGDGGTADAGPAAKLPPSALCQTDADCASGMCRPVLLGTRVCVTPCTGPSDCSAIPDAFCEPVAGGALNGLCVPRSPAHCMACASDAECGSLAEACFVAPGDVSAACHVDCTLGGAAACPVDYTCASASVNGSPRQVCVPTAGTCADALGGFCDRVNAPEPCKRLNAAGECGGQRTCIAASARYSACDAPAPQCKATCAVQDPAGCATSFCPSATSGTDNCGRCGNACPGVGAASANVACVNAACTFTCQGESYDVNGNPADGCEVTDSPVGNHSVQTPTYAGSFSCTDGDSQLHLGGQLPSDARAHVPAIVGFSAANGDAPDFHRIHASGGLTCTDDVNVYLQLSGAQHPSCYRMTLTTSVRTQVCTTDGNGFCKIENGSGSYGDGTDITIVIDKTCAQGLPDRPTYVVTGHL